MITSAILYKTPDGYDICSFKKVKDYLSAMTFVTTFIRSHGIKDFSWKFTTAKTTRITAYEISLLNIH